MKTLKISIIICSVILLSNGYGYSAIRYVWSGGSNTSPFDSWAKASTTIQNAHTGSQPGDTIEIAAGTYSNGSNSTLTVTINNLIIKTTSDPTHTGTVILKNSNAYTTVLVTATGLTLQGTNEHPMRILYTGSNQSRYTIGVNPNFSMTGRYLDCNTSNTAGAAVLALTGTTNIFWHCNFINTNYTSVTAYGALDTGNCSSTFNSCNFWGGYYGIYGGGTGTTTVNNCNVLGSIYKILIIDNATRTINCNNCVLGGSIGAQLQYCIDEGPGQINLNSCATFGNWYYSALPGYPAQITATNCISNKFPQFKRLGREGVIPFGLDDVWPVADVRATADALNKYGKHMTWFINVAAMTPEHWNLARDLVLDGHDIGGHGYTHTEMTYNNAIHFQYFGQGGPATVEFTASRILQCRTSTHVDEFDVNTNEIDTLGEILDANQPNWAFTKSTDGGQDATWIYDSVLATSLKPMGATEAPCNLEFDKTDDDCTDGCDGFYGDEVYAVKSKIEDEIRTVVPGWECVSFAFPFSAYDPNCKNAVRTSGYEIMRGGPTASLRNVNIFDATKVIALDNIGATIDEVVSSANNLAFQVDQFGLGLSVMMHNTTNWTKAGSTSFLEAMVKTLTGLNTNVCDYRELNDLIRLSGRWTDAGGGIWSREWENNFDFSLLPNSPLIDTGANLDSALENAVSPLSIWPASIVTERQNLDGRWDIGLFTYSKSGAVPW
ncbi:MAG: polysaccharide deacetylase family protein [bacterium]